MSAAPRRVVQAGPRARIEMADSAFHSGAPALSLEVRHIDGRSAGIMLGAAALRELHAAITCALERMTGAAPTEDDGRPWHMVTARAGRGRVTP